MQGLFASPTRQPAFFIGSVPVYGRLALAPMDGISNPPFRLLCRQAGSALTYTEFVSAIDAMHANARMRQRTAFIDAERPVLLQLLDNSPDRLEKAALNLLGLHPDAIDINMGCPAKDIAGRGAGAGMMRTPELAAEAVRRICALSTVPVTVKFRLGWDEHTRSYLEFAQAMEEAGASLLAVHGRTRSQFYTGQADWQAIAEVKAAAKVPVLANGDINTVTDLKNVASLTGCDGFLIGRAALRNPFLFLGKDKAEVSIHELVDWIRKHMRANAGYYGEEKGLILLRKHILWYMQDFGYSAALRRRILETTSVVTLDSLLIELENTAFRLK